MATVNKDFKIKSGLIVEGTTARVNNYDVLTKNQDDQDYIVGLIGGTATSQNTPDTVVKRDSNGNFSAGTITADLDGTAASVDSLSGHTTTEISEGNNLYFTNQRALDATAQAYDAAGSASTAQQNAENYADGVAGDAYDNAVSYADGLASNYDPAGSAQGAYDNAVSAAAQDATTKANAAESNANAYTDDAISQEVSDRNSAISTAITNLDLAGTYDALGAAASALSDANDYTDTAVANLVDGAPALLDTLNELAAAIADNPNYATDVANLVATKADTSYVDSEISDLDTAAQGYATSAENSAKGYADSLASNYDAAGAATTAYNNAVSYTDQEISALDSSAQDYADTAEQNAKNYADGLAVNYDAAGAAEDALNSANSYTNTSIGNLTTDDIEEGVDNLYYTNSRAQDAAISLLTGPSAVLNNIEITTNGNGDITITAENGVADSTTDDLEEGQSNLYFTDERAVSALENVVPNFSEIDINSVAKQIAAQTGNIATASTNTVYSFNKGDFRSAKFLIKCAYGSHTELTEVLLTLDSSDNIAMTEYAIVGTNGSSMSVSADIDMNNVRLRVTTVNNNSVVTVTGTLLA